MNERDLIKSFAEAVAERFSVNKIAVEHFPATNTYFIDILPKSIFNDVGFQKMASDFIDSWEEAHTSSVAFIRRDSLIHLSFDAEELFLKTETSVKWNIIDKIGLQILSSNDLAEINKPFEDYSVFLSKENPYPVAFTTLLNRPALPSNDWSALFSTQLKTSQQSIWANINSSILLESSDSLWTTLPFQMKTKKEKITLDASYAVAA
ncbi:MAG TPA: hypothetical protein VMM58_08525 [Bacteroidota bacterium]|nr:hypothetical protein [Bacteroidota bacterium]